MLSYEVKFLTNEDTVYVKNGDFKSNKYESKRRSDESVYDASKRSYCERRGGSTISRTRALRQLETKLRDKNIIACKWSSENFVTLVFSSGVIAYVTVKAPSLDVTQVVFDKFCVGKLVGHAMTAVCISKSAILFIAAERTATLITFGKILDSNKPYLLSEREPSIQVVELGGSARRVERHVSSYEHGNIVNVLVWGSTTSEPAPWSPIIEDHANLHLYQITGQQFTLIAYHQLENEILSAELSQKYENVVHIVEQIACHKNGVTLTWYRYELPHGSRSIKLSTVPESVTRVSLLTPVRAVQRSPCDAKLLAACIDGCIHVVDHSVGVIHTTRAGFIATDVRWAGDVIVATEEAGRLQCFDRALSPLHQHTKFLDLTSYLRDSRRVQILATHSARGGPLLLATFTGGPLFLMKISHPRLVTAWLRAGRMSNAVSLVNALDWDANATDCVRSIDEVLRAAARCGAVAGERAAQAALGAYLAPPAPLPRPAHLHARAIHDRARVFYHNLLRRGRIEKALSLGVELSAWDLFADARWAAARRGLTALADEAAELARNCASDSECSDSCSQCSSHSCSESEDESSTSSKATKTHPPPLPRVPVPPQPSILTVPITPQEPHSTTSIRPNLHQYLERDSTIWVTNATDPTRPKDLQDSIWTHEAAHETIWENGEPSWERDGDKMEKETRDTWKIDAQDKREDAQNAIWLREENERLWKNKRDAIGAMDARYFSGRSTDLLYTSGIKEPRPAVVKDARHNLYVPKVRQNISTNIRDDTFIHQISQSHFTPLQSQNLRWNSVDNVLSSRQRPKPATPGNFDTLRDNRISNFRHVYQAELKEVPSRELSSPNVNFNGRYRPDSWTVRPEREKNKVKFSETVTVAVVPQEPSASPAPDVARELADSLPLCAPHNYLAAFAPATNGTAPPRPPKIKVVHFGMV
ncbi:WD repeat-containing and planar cell polarity effector protein fritz homolog [Aricia agestis]|uniref:WD repeat-containing and planar cell polarity effector protein fritz homolog n=1 Tax=Aricia agestis TaxID=91739 RepID=UPI001C20624D|nr:WD repeat-containing and planar cell polarity effector protein fritz homolog [Aricia agestis]